MMQFEPGAPKLDAEDQMDIIELYARYAWGIDTGDVEAYLEAFVPDAVLMMSKQAKGHAELAEWHRNFMKDSAFPGSQHFSAEFRIMETDGTRARVRAYMSRMYRRPGMTNSSIIFQGYYTDTCVKVDGRWYFELKGGHEANQLMAGELEPASYPQHPIFLDPGASR
jgi:hypothetical protein